MAFDNLQFRSCSFNYNHNGIIDTPDNHVTTETKDIGNGSNACLKFDLTPLQTIWNEDVTVSAQVEFYFQALVVGDASGNTTADSPSWLSKVPVEQRQGLFRLPRYYDSGSGITNTVYKVEKSENDRYYLFLDTTIVKGLHKTTRTDGSAILGYPPTGATEGVAVTDLYYPEPTITDEFTIKRLTHSITDFVTYQAGGQLTSNLLNFQKDQEMFLIQELLWTIEMDMLTFSDLAGFGSIVTAGNDGTIDPTQIRLSLYELTDTQDLEGTASNVVLYKTTSPNGTWNEIAKTDLLQIGDLSNVTVDSDTLAGGHVVFYDATSGGWKNGTVNDATDSCSEKQASVFKLCNDPVTANRTVAIDGIVTNNNTNWTNVLADDEETLLMTAQGISLVPIEGLNNVTITTPSTNQVLYYDATGVWKNINLASLTTGILGPAGGDTFKFNLDYNDATDPVSGELILLQSNGTSAATTWASTSFIRVSTTDANSAAISDWLDTLGTGDSAVKSHVKLFKEGTPAQYAIFNVTAVTNSGAFRTLTVTPVSSNVNPSEDAVFYLTASYVGDKGDTGTAGTNGTNGSQGVQGFQGISIDAISCTLVDSDTDLRFTFERDNPANVSPAPADIVVTCADFNGASNVQILYIHQYQINSTGYGMYNYVLTPNADGTGTPVNAINYSEMLNTETGSGANRIFGGVTYTQVVGDTTRVDGIHPVTTDTIQLLPIGNGLVTGTGLITATYKIPVFCKAVTGTHNGFSYTKVFSVPNIHYTKQCG